MNKKNLRWPLALITALFGLVGMGMSTAGAGMAAQTPTTDPVEVVRAFWGAYNNKNTATMQTLTDPAFRLVVDPRAVEFTPGLPRELTFEQFVEQAVQVGINSIEQTAPDTVLAVLTISGEEIPPLPHPFMSSFVATVTNGRIIRIVETISDQTIQDLQALFSEGESEVGMPRTGSNDQVLPAVAVVLGLVILVGGVLLKRSVTTAR